MRNSFAYAVGQTNALLADHAPYKALAVGAERCQERSHTLVEASDPQVEGVRRGAWVMGDADYRRVFMAQGQLPPQGVNQRLEDARRRKAKIGICMPGLAEIVGGLEASDSREASWEIARRRLGKLVCWPFDRAATYEYGHIFAELKRRGRPMQQIDIST